MSEFKPGDEVVCIENEGWDWSYFDMTKPTIGEVYTIQAVRPDEPTAECPDEPLELALLLVEMPNLLGSYPAQCFRKVQRRDLSAWLETAATDTDRWDKPIKAPAPLHPVPSVDALFRRIMAGGDR